MAEIALRMPSLPEDNEPKIAGAVVIGALVLLAVLRRALR